MKLKAETILGCISVGVIFISCIGAWYSKNSEWLPLGEAADGAFSILCNASKA